MTARNGNGNGRPAPRPNFGDRLTKAVADCVGDGTIPADKAEDLVIVCGVFIHPAADDNAKILKFNHEATVLAIKSAMKGSPSASEVVSQKETAKHPFA